MEFATIRLAQVDVGGFPPHRRAAHGLAIVQRCGAHMEQLGKLWVLNNQMSNRLCRSPFLCLDVTYLCAICLYVRLDWAQEFVVRCSDGAVDNVGV